VKTRKIFPNTATDQSADAAAAQTVSLPMTPKRRVAFYLRHSTTAQNSDSQLKELHAVAANRGWRVVEIFEDAGVSGAKGRDERKALDAMLKAASRGEFEILCCFSIDRLGRSLQHLITTVNDLHALGIEIFFTQQNIDTTTPSGKLIFNVFASFASFEREMIRSRVVAGIALAKAKGVKLGRPPSVTHQTRNAIEELYKKGMSVKRIAKSLSCGVGTTVMTLKDRGLYA